MHDTEMGFMSCEDGDKPPKECRAVGKKRPAAGIAEPAAETSDREVGEDSADDEGWKECHD